MDELRQTTLAKMLQFLPYNILQAFLPAMILISTPKQSPLRPFGVAAMLFITSIALWRFRPMGLYIWCQTISQTLLISHVLIMIPQSFIMLVVNPLDQNDLFPGNSKPRNWFHALFRAARILIELRGVNWPWQCRNIPPHPQYYARRGMKSPRRGPFLLRQLVIFSWQYIVLDIVQNAPKQVSPQTTSASMKWNVSVGEWIERIITHLLIGIVVSRSISDSIYRLFSLVFVGLGVDSTSNWPPLFGTLKDSYTLRNFWGKSWHQYLRNPFGRFGIFVARDVLYLPRSSALGQYTVVLVAFLFSGFLHLGLDFMQKIPLERMGAVTFFTAVSLGLLFEDLAQGLWRRLYGAHSQNAPPSPWKKMIGFCWVALWLGVTSTVYFGPMMQSPDPPATIVPFSLVEKIGLDAALIGALSSGVLIAWWLEVEI